MALFKVFFLEPAEKGHSGPDERSKVNLLTETPLLVETFASKGILLTNSKCDGAAQRQVFASSICRTLDCRERFSGFCESNFDFDGIFQDFPDFQKLSI